MPSAWPRFDPALLATFLTVLEVGRVSAAAKALHLSQPAVTAQLRKLEGALGTVLFVRSAQGVAPTEAGLRLAVHARAVRRLLEVAVADVAPKAEPSGPLAIAASTTIASHVLPILLGKFRVLHPDVAIQVHVDNTDGVVAAVRSGRVPLGLVEGHARASGVRLEAFLDDEIVPVVGRDAPFTIRHVRDLDTVPFLWREAGSGTRAVVERAVRQAGLPRRTARHLDLELGSTEAILGCTVANLGIAFVSLWSARVHITAGFVRVVPGLDLVLRRTFRWAVPAGGLGGMAARFHAFAQTARLT